MRVGASFDAAVWSESLWPMLVHPIPKAVAGPMGWWYIFGSAAMTLLMIQIVTGVGLALVYVPAADQAYESLLFLNYEQPLGWFLRALHYYAGSGMVVLLLVHMAQVFLHGAYKYPRELTWIVGVFLLLFTLGMFFTGQILRWDPDAYWGLAVGGSMAGRVPVLGPWIVTLMLGGPVIGWNSLSRLFTLHVFVIPSLLLLSLAVHLWLVIKKGISAPPIPGQAVNPTTYDAEYERELKTGVPFLGEAIQKDIVFSALVVIVVVALATLWAKGTQCLPTDLGGESSAQYGRSVSVWPTFNQSSRGRDIYHSCVSRDPDHCFVLCSFISNRGGRAPGRRPIAVISVVLIVTV